MPKPGSLAHLTMADIRRAHTRPLMPLPCFDCGAWGSQCNMEPVDRDGVRELVCLECFEWSGEDNWEQPKPKRHSVDRGSEEYDRLNGKER